jgi:hypothetical protein
MCRFLIVELSNFIEAIVHMLKKLNDETLARSIKQNIEQREWKYKEKGPNFEPKRQTQNGTQRAKRTNYILEPHQSQEAYQKRKGKGNLKK